MQLFFSLFEIWFLGKNVLVLISQLLQKFNLFRSDSLHPFYLFLRNFRENSRVTWHEVTSYLVYLGSEVILKLFLFLSHVIRHLFSLSSHFFLLFRLFLWEFFFSSVIFSEKCICFSCANVLYICMIRIIYNLISVNQCCIKAFSLCGG